MLGVYNYTVVLTYIGMLTGFGGITFAMGNEPGKALACLMIAGVCDMFDGKIASTMERTKKEKRFGVQIDSLSDLICFGVLPAVIVYSQSSSRLRILPSAFYLLCALIRLAWYNVDEEERQDTDPGRRHVYTGLPVTFAALIFPVTIRLTTAPGPEIGWVPSLVMIITAVAFLTPFKIVKPSVRLKSGN